MERSGGEGWGGSVEVGVEGGDKICIGNTSERWIWFGLCSTMVVQMEYGTRDGMPCSCAMRIINLNMERALSSEGFTCAVCVVI